MLRTVAKIGAWIGRGAADLWLALGVALVAFAVMEGGYRAVSGGPGGRRSSSVDSTQHPYANAPWWVRYQGAAGLASRQNQFDPYRGHWARPSTSEFVKVDSLGRRVVAQPQAWRDAPRKVFMLGGSALWGVTARDSFDIPSLTAASLGALGVGPVEVVNLAQAAYNSTQELNTLALELARGRVPVVAVFFDGYNDIATAWKYGEPGHTYGDEAIDQQIRLGNRGFWAELAGLGRHSAVLGRLGNALGIIETPPGVRGAPVEICGPVAKYYRRVATLVQEMAAKEGFRVAYFLQPVHVSTAKRLTAWEQHLPKQRSLAACMTSIDSAMADRRGSVFFPLVDLFDQDSATVFVDENAHITEDANRKVAARIAATIAPWLATAATPPAVVTRPGRPSGSGPP